MNELVVFAGVIALASVIARSQRHPGDRSQFQLRHRRIAPTILGNISLLFLAALAAAMGVSAILLAMPALYDGLRLVGAAHLVFLGLRAPPRARQSRGGQMAGAPVPEMGPLRRHLQAFFVSATNLQSVFFLAALFPNFVHRDQPLAPQFLVLFSVLILVVGSVHLAYALSAGLVQSRIGDRRFRQAVQAGSGIALLGFGAVVASSVFRRG